ncbi:hypothetical protein ACJBXQ_11290 [Streptococcus suis]
MTEYGTHLTIQLAKLHLKGKNATKKLNDYHVRNAETQIEFRESEVSFFNTTHSIQ